MIVPPSPSTIGSQTWLGAVAESLTQYRLNRYGFPTFQAGNQLPYDLVTEVHGIHLKVQVKSASMLAKKTPGCSDVHRFQLFQGKLKVPYLPGSVDLFAFVASDLELIHFMLPSEIPAQKTMRIKSARFNKIEEGASLDRCLSSLLRLPAV